jgi:hypothetical protein
VAGRREAERATLLAATDREAYLLANSRLPGPRANLELLGAAGDVLSRDNALRLASLGPDAAPAGTPREFLPCCGNAAIGRLIAEGDTGLVPRLRDAAADPRWRVRESVAIALQRWGDADVDAMLAAVAPWASGTPFEARAAVAAICEPRLLATRTAVDGAVRVLDAATERLVALPRPRGEPARVLGASLGYGWSVAVAADAGAALPAFERWARSDDPDVRRMVASNVGKARFVRAAPEAAARLGGSRRAPRDPDSP